MVVEIKLTLPVKRNVDIMPLTFNFKTSWDKHLLLTQTQRKNWILHLK